MEDSTNYIWILNTAAILLVVVFRYGYLAVLHKVYGAKLYAIHKSQNKLSFKTVKSQFQLDKTRRMLIHKGKKDRHWKTITFDQIANIYVEKNADTASINEFIFSDFSLFDFFEKYRDKQHSYNIRLKILSEHPVIDNDVTVLSLNQYEQREFWLGQMFHNLDIWILTKLGLYTRLDDVYHDKVNEITDLFNDYLELDYLELDYEQ